MHSHKKSNYSHSNNCTNSGNAQHQATTATIAPLSCIPRTHPLPHRCRASTQKVKGCSNNRCNKNNVTWHQVAWHIRRSVQSPLSDPEQQNACHPKPQWSIDNIKQGRRRQQQQHEQHTQRQPPPKGQRGRQRLAQPPQHLRSRPPVQTCCAPSRPSTSTATMSTVATIAPMPTTRHQQKNGVRNRAATKRPRRIHQCYFSQEKDVKGPRVC